MKLIDEKGKVFGKVSIIDLAVLVVILLIIGAAVYKFGGNSVKSMMGEEIKTKDITFTVKCTVKNEAYAKSIHVLDRLTSLNAYTDAYIESFTYSPAVISAIDSEGKPVYSNDPIKKDELIVIKMKVNAEAQMIKLGTQEILIGGSFTVKTQDASFVGVVEDVQGK